MTLASSETEMDLMARLKASETQLQIYAHDFGKLLQKEREKSAQLEAANEQLQQSTRELQRSFEAEQRRSGELEKAHHDALLRLLRASRFRDNESASHLRRMKHLSKIMAQHFGWSPDLTDLFATASSLHDVGKIGVPDAILHKPGPLTQEEWRVMKRHPAFGALLLQGSGSRLLEMARAIALCHHEHWDGSGYPRGLKSDDIPPTARIVTLIDCYDVLRTARPYKTPLSHARAYEVLLTGDGRTRPQHFDPQVLEAFRELHERFEETHVHCYL